jgi:tetratricopeptide (TPR) repeat protein
VNNKRISYIIVLFLFFNNKLLSSQTLCYKDSLVLPAYQIQPPDLNPMFFTYDSYQGASRVIYPYPLTDNISNSRQDKKYKALYLENKYIKLCVLPEIGGRLFYATDKTNNYEIFYRQNVIKPANIGMIGAWISGGIEWCVFHHHRTSSFLPVDYTLSRNKDGSATIWIGEIELRHRMKWTIGITLYPEKSYIEVSVKMFNRTENPHSFLYWANVATHVHEDYRILFPPSVQYATFHAKNSFSHWPITREVYNNHKYYKNNIDASWWKNHPNPVSFFVYNLQDDFFAGYDFKKDAGTMHIGNHHIVAGAKLWEWGPGEYGKMWDCNILTDSDGPYAELMTGAFSDNQPDYSWIKPYEVKHFKQYWYPLRNTRGVKNANLNAAVNLDLDSANKAMLAFNTTQKYQNAKIILFANNRTIYKKITDIDPSNPFQAEITFDHKVELTDLETKLYTTSDEEIISYKPKKRKLKEDLPPIVTPPSLPEEIKTIEELYLIGLRLKQFYNARINSLNYFTEALKRDPYDSRCNIQLGLDLKKRGLFDEAAQKFRIAIKRLTKDYTRPINCEPFYHLGVILKNQKKYHAAIDTLYRATWDYAFHSAAYYQLAEISCIQNNFNTALDQIGHSLNTNSINIKALNLKCALLRRSGRSEETWNILKEILVFDPLNFFTINEFYLNKKEYNKIEDADSLLRQLRLQMRDNQESYLELAVEYINFNFIDEAIDVLLRAVELNKPFISRYPIIHYYLGYLYLIKNNSISAAFYFKKAMYCPVDFCFPFRSETIKVLKKAVNYNQKDSKAYYYLGNLLYDIQPDSAICNWEKAVSLNKSFAIAYRNLGFAYKFHRKEIQKAIKYYETAIKYNNQQPRYFYELDELYDVNGTALSKRLEMFENNHHIIIKRPDSFLREIYVLVLAGKYDKADNYLMNHFFPRQEGIVSLHDIYVDLHLLRGLQYFNDQNYNKALNDFLKADVYPENHQIGRSPDYIKNPQIYYLIGQCFDKLNNPVEAEKYYHMSVNQDSDDSEFLFYKGLVYKNFRQGNKAEDIFNNMIQKAKEKLNEKNEIDFFAKFGEEMSVKKQKASAYYMLGLGYLGLALKSEAKEHFNKTLDLDINHIWAKYYLNKL